MIYIERTQVQLDEAPLVLFDNILLDGTVTATTEAANAEVENLLTDSTFDFWKPTTTSGTVSLSLGSSATASALGISGHDLGTQGATVTVKRGATTVATVSPTDNSTILILFASGSSTSYSVQITGATAAPYISNMVLGVPLVFATGIVPSYTPLWMAEDVELLQNESLGGQFFQNRVIRKSANTAVNLNILDRDFIEADPFQNFRRHFNDGRTFFFAAGPSTFENDISFCRRSGETLKPTFANAGIFYQVAMQLEAYIG
jgi:hypothetical protein